MNVILSSILGAVLFGAALLSTAGEPDIMTRNQHRGAAGEIDVMTQNQYLGADLAPLLEAATSGGPFDPMAFNNALVEALAKIAASRPAERARSPRRLRGASRMWSGCRRPIRLNARQFPVSSCRRTRAATTL